MAGEEVWTLKPASLSDMRIGIAQGLPLQDLDDTVSSRFAFAVDALRKAKADLRDMNFPVFDEMVHVNRNGNMIPPEAFALHRDRLQRRGADVDPNVRARIERAGALSAGDYIEMAQARLGLIAKMDDALAECDAIIIPTTPIVAPRVADVATPDSFVAANMQLLRNTAMVNFFNLCAISLPLPREGGLPVGLMLVARNGQDHRLFRVASTIEKLLK
jgi:aspartyl-tRNA(Asn)/glutamyl-tRNA(Gln) amidotransferase subunit A